MRHPGRRYPRAIVDSEPEKSRLMKKLILIGGNRDKQSGPLLTFARLAQELGVAVEVISEPWHLSMIGKGGKTLESTLNDAAIPFRCLEKISAESFDNHAEETSICVLVNAIWFIKQDIIDLYKVNWFRNEEWAAGQQSKKT